MEQYLYFDDLKLKIETMRLWSLHEYGKTLDERQDDGDELKITSINVILPETGFRLVGLKIVFVKPRFELKSDNLDECFWSSILKFRSPTINISDVSRSSKLLLNK